MTVKRLNLRALSATPDDSGSWVENSPWIVRRNDVVVSEQSFASGAAQERRLTVRVKGHRKARAVLSLPEYDAPEMKVAAEHARRATTPTLADVVVAHIVAAKAEGPAREAWATEALRMKQSRDAVVKPGRAKAGRASGQHRGANGRKVRRILELHPGKKLKALAAILANDYGIGLTPQAIGQHRKAILKANKAK
jgi:hypothetical protein